MKKIYFTVAGMNYRYGSEIVAKGTKVRLVKEPDNQYDPEAIRVEMEGIGLIGYVANSVATRLGESYSAGRLYDKMGEKALGTILLTMPQGAIGYVLAKKVPNVPIVEEYNEEDDDFEDDDFEDEDDLVLDGEGDPYKAVFDAQAPSDEGFMNLDVIEKEAPLE